MFCLMAKWGLISIVISLLPGFKPGITAQMTEHYHNDPKK